MRLCRRRTEPEVGKELTNEQRCDASILVGTTQSLRAKRLSRLSAVHLKSGGFWPIAGTVSLPIYFVTMLKRRMYSGTSNVNYADTKSQMLSI